MNRTTEIKELAYRENDGIEVALLWQPDADRLHVSVLDTRTGEAFQVDASAANALDVFYHPFAHAAFRQLELVGDQLDTEALAL